MELGFPGGSDGKEKPLATWQTWVRSLDWEDLLEEGMATQYLPGESPWTEKPGGLQPVKLQCWNILCLATGFFNCPHYHTLQNSFTPSFSSSCCIFHPGPLLKLIKNY